MSEGEGRARRRAAAWLAGAALSSLLLVYHPAPGWGVNSRLALVFAVVDEGRFTIDSYHDREPTWTSDKAYYEGHYYSDKVFGLSLLALPAYAALRAGGALVGWRPGFHESNYWLRVFAVSLPAAASVALLFALLLRLGAPARGALLASVVAFWGSLWFGFSTTFFPYAPGIAGLAGALWLLLAAPLSPGRAAAVGGACGLAMICDMSFGFAVLGVVVVFLLAVANDAGRRTVPALERPAAPRPRPLAWLAAGGLAGLAPLALFAAYSISIFGTPTIPYEYEYLEGFRVPMQQGLMGVSWPRPGALWFLTLHPYRGILFWSPWVALAVAGAGVSLRAGGTRRLAGALALWSFGAYLLANSGYYMWWGGWCMGSRFLLPMLAFVPLGLAEVVRRRAGRLALAATGGVAIALSAPLSLLDPETPMVNDYAALLDVGLHRSYAVPQLDYLRLFYAAESWWGPESHVGMGAVLALGLPALALAFAWRGLPDDPGPKS